MSRYHQGRFIPKNPSKYAGNPQNIVYRSSWEKSVFVWCDMNPNVENWSSEELIVQYVCRTDGQQHRYFPDIIIKYSSGAIVMVEIKPSAQTKRPVIKKGMRKRRILEESYIYNKNVSKWEAAIEFCRKRNWSFQIWTEETLKRIGVRNI